MKRMAREVAMSGGWILGLMMLVGQAGADAPVDSVQETFLDVDDAFRLEAGATAAGAVQVGFAIAPGYHLYRERISFDVADPTLALAPVDLPPGESRFDANFGREMVLYEGRVAFEVGLSGAAPFPRSAVLTVHYQGCADAGLCYPPQDRDLRLAFGAGGQVVTVATPGADASASSSAAPVAPAEPAASASPIAVPSSGGAVSTGPVPAPGRGTTIESALSSGRLGVIAVVFLVAGLLLSLTPCVLPMVPILSSIIVGEGAAVSRRRGFTLASAYSLGMAAAYTLFGIAAGLAGEGLAGFLQNAWVLGTFAMLMAALSLSLFGVYELQMPSFVQTRLTLASGRLRGGRHASVFAMGVASALIVGPCVAAPLAGALVYISQTRDVIVGGVALFSMAMGMSVPLLLVGLSAGALLPRAGRWMEAVKIAMGMGLLGVAWWMVAPVAPPALALLLLGAWFAAAATWLGVFHPLPPGGGHGRAFAKAAGVLCMCVSVAQIAGALSGATSPWQPLRPLAATTIGTASAEPGVTFERVGSQAQLDDGLAKADGAPVLVDFYADWCTACRELEHTTFADPRVRQRLSGLRRLQVDLTANGEAERALLRRFRLFGPPAILVMDGDGAERARVIGFQDADRFLATLSASGL